MNKLSPYRLIDFKNFNVNWKNKRFLIPILALIIIPAFLKIKFGITRLQDFIVTFLIAFILYNIPFFKVPDNEYQNVNERKQKNFLFVFLPIIALLIALPVFYGPMIQNFLINTLHVDPNTALDSIRSFLGLSSPQ